MQAKQQERNALACMHAYVEMYKQLAVVVLWSLGKSMSTLTLTHTHTHTHKQLQLEFSYVPAKKRKRGRESAG